MTTDNGLRSQPPPHQPVYRGGVTHYLYEGRVSFEVDEDDGSSTVVLHDGQHDLGDEFASKLALLFGADVDGTRITGGRRLRILIEDLDAASGEKRHALDGDGVDQEFVDQLHAIRELPYGTELLARTCRDWQYVWRKAIRQLRTAHLTVMAYELTGRERSQAATDEGVDPAGASA
jgi:hypothetical protein